VGQGSGWTGSACWELQVVDLHNASAVSVAMAREWFLMGFIVGVFWRGFGGVLREILPSTREECSPEFGSR